MELNSSQTHLAAISIVRVVYQLLANQADYPVIRLKRVRINTKCSCVFLSECGTRLGSWQKWESHLLVQD